jgi:hypothetical protein
LRFQTLSDRHREIVREAQRGPEDGDFIEGVRPQVLDPYRKLDPSFGRVSANAEEKPAVHLLFDFCHFHFCRQVASQRVLKFA